MNKKELYYNLNFNFFNYLYNFIEWEKKFKDIYFSLFVSENKWTYKIEKIKTKNLNKDFEKKILNEIIWKEFKNITHNNWFLSNVFKIDLRQKVAKIEKTNINRILSGSIIYKKKDKNEFYEDIFELSWNIDSIVLFHNNNYAFWLSWLFYFHLIKEKDFYAVKKFLINYEFINSIFNKLENLELKLLFKNFINFLKDIKEWDKVEIFVFEPENNFVKFSKKLFYYTDNNNMINELDEEIENTEQNNENNITDDRLDQLFNLAELNLNLRNENEWIKNINKKYIGIYQYLMSKNREFINKEERLLNFRFKTLKYYFRNFNKKEVENLKNSINLLERKFGNIRISYIYFVDKFVYSFEYIDINDINYYTPIKKLIFNDYKIYFSNFYIKNFWTKVLFDFHKIASVFHFLLENWKINEIDFEDNLFSWITNNINSAEKRCIIRQNFLQMVKNIYKNIKEQLTKDKIYKKFEKNYKRNFLNNLKLFKFVINNFNFLVESFFYTLDLSDKEKNILKNLLNWNFEKNILKNLEYFDLLKIILLFYYLIFYILFNKKSIKEILEWIKFKEIKEKLFYKCVKNRRLNFFDDTLYKLKIKSFDINFIKLFLWNFFIYENINKYIDRLNYVLIVKLFWKELINLEKKIKKTDDFLVIEKEIDSYINKNEEKLVFLKDADINLKIENSKLEELKEKLKNIKRYLILLITKFWISKENLLYIYYVNKLLDSINRKENNIKIEHLEWLWILFLLIDWLEYYFDKNIEEYLIWEKKVNIDDFDEKIKNEKIKIDLNVLWIDVYKRTDIIFYNIWSKNEIGYKIDAKKIFINWNIEI